jgi:carbon-monoxide dehydrogenase medium subunit
MKPPQFEYFAPATKQDALGIVARYAGDAMVLAGGQSLLPMMNFRLVAPAALVDLNPVSELAYIRERDALVTIGAMTRQRTIEFSPIVAAKLPLLRDAVRLIAHLPIRSRGTIGGSLAHADPAAELPMILLALDGEVVVENSGGERTIKSTDLYRTLFTTSLAPGEILTEIRIPAMAPGTGHAIEEFARREGDFAIAAVAVTIAREETGVSARLATAGTGPVPTRLFEAEDILERQGLDEASIEAASRKAAETIEPESDQQASADFRRHLTRVLTGRALRRAVRSAA